MSDSNFIARVGPRYSTTGSTQEARITTDASLVVAQGRGKYAELSERGQIFVACNAAAGVAPGTELTALPPISLWNPPTSTKNLFVLKTQIAYLSGTLGIGFIDYVKGTQNVAAPTTGTELTVQCGKINNGGNSGRAFTGSTYTATGVVVASPYSIGPVLATTVTMPNKIEDIVDGMICIPPGYWFGMEEIGGAGTSPKVIFSIYWEEHTVQA